AKAVGRESLECVALPARGHAKPPERYALIIFVGNAEARFQIQVTAELPQQFGAERVNRPAPHAVGSGAEVSLEAARDLFRGLVRKREGANARRVGAVPLDEKPNSLRETERLPCSRSGEHQQRLRVGLDREP